MRPTGRALGCALLAAAIVAAAAPTADAVPSQPGANAPVAVTPDDEQVSIPFDQSRIEAMPDLDRNDPQVVRTVQGFQPEGIHVTPWQMTDEGWTVLVSWQTGESVVGLTGSPLQPHDPDQVAAVVEWGADSPDASSGGRAAGGTSLVYSNKYLDHPADKYAIKGHTYNSPILHHVLVTGLPPGETVSYRVGNDKDGWSEQLSFSVPGAPDTWPLRIGVIGDLGLTANSSATLEGLTESAPDIILHTGDVPYADRYCSDGSWKFPDDMPPWGICTWDSDQRRWDDWARLTAPLLSAVPFLSTPGTHENEALLADNNITFQAFNARYPAPQDPGVINTSPIWANTLVDPHSLRKWGADSDSAMPNNSYFSVDVQGAHIISLSNYAPYGPDSAQYRWLEEDLASVDRNSTPWVILMLHESPYHTYNYHYKEMEEAREIYEPLWYEAGVDIALFGHMHAYERTLPMYNYTVDPCGPIYITIGNGGNSEGTPCHGEECFVDVAHPSYCDNPEEFGEEYRLYAAKAPIPLFFPTTYKGDYLLTFQDGKFCPDEQPAWSAHRELSFGHGVLDLESPTRATWRYLRNDPGGAPTEADRVVIEKTAGTCEKRV